MFFLIHGILIFIYLTAIIFVCSLFTNAIELLGSKLKLSNNVIGGILAVIGTTLPETIVPIVAIVGSFILKKSTGSEIALGAIIGSPFMLSCLAMSLIGVSLLILKRKELNVDKKNVLRFYKYFFITYITGILATFVHNYIFKILIVVFLITTYISFIKRTLNKSKDEFSQNSTDELLLNKLLKIKNTNLPLIYLQIAISLFGLVLFSHHFVNQIEIISNALNLSPVVLSLIVTPFATELPECINSIIWTKNNKDELAIANVLGAIIFQSVIPISIGILFTPWILDKTILLNSFVVILCSIFTITMMLLFKKLLTSSLIFCFVFYISYIIFILL